MLFSGVARCLEPPAFEGPCKAATTKWTFDEGTCHKFVFGGCRGNENRFDSKAECKAKCSIRNSLLKKMLRCQLRGVCH